jgi:predicted aspartyl protease
MRRQYLHLLKLLSVWTGLALAGQPAIGAHRRAELDRPLTTTVGFQLYRDYLIVVQGSVGPLKGLNFLLDTGTSPSVLTPRLAERLHLNPTSAVLAVLSGNVQGGFATVPSLEFGPVRAVDLPVMFADLSLLQSVLPIPIDGVVGLDVLGQSALGQSAFEIDYVSRTLRFGPSAAMRDSISSAMPTFIPLQIKNGLAVVDATVNHASAHLVLDTGAATLVVFKPAPSPAPNGSAPAGPVPTGPVPTGPAPTGLKPVSAPPLPRSLPEVEHREISLASFSLGDAEFGHEPAFVVPNPVDAGHDFDGLMSPAALGIKRVAIDLARGTLAFTLE